MSYEDQIAADARLIIIKELAQQIDGRMNEIGLQRVLDVFGISRTRQWVRTQLNMLGQLGGVHLSEAGTVMVAALTKLGRDHVDRRAIIDGVSRPSDED